MQGPSSLVEGACTATAMVLFCVLLCSGLLLLTGLAWLLGTLGASVLIMPVIAFGMIANLPLSFILGGRLARRLFPRSDS